MKKIIFIVMYCINIQIDYSLHAQQPITLFCHGIIDSKHQINHYADYVQQPSASFDFVDAQEPNDWDMNTLIFKSSSLFGKKVNRNNMYMATGQDIATLQQQINPNHQYILYGFSRGGAAAINYIAQHNPDNIQALILEATPADMIDAVVNFQSNIGYKFTLERSTQELLFHALFPAYQLHSIPPVQNIAHIINKHLPIFIVHSYNDQRVTIDAAYKLYLAFLQAGFTDVYFLQLNSADHAFYRKSSDKLLHLQALHSFYKKYQFAYNPNYAILQDLTWLQPSAQEIEDKLDHYKQKIESNYQAQKIFNQHIAVIALATLLFVGIGWKIYESESKQ